MYNKKKKINLRSYYFNFIFRFVRRIISMKNRKSIFIYTVKRVLKKKKTVKSLIIKLKKKSTSLNTY